MPKKILLKYFSALCLLVILAWPRASAQFGNTYYHMFGIPQANQLNPAFQPGCDGYIGLPSVSPVRFEAESNSLAFGDVFSWDKSLKKYTSFMYSDGNKQKFLDALEPVNQIRAELASSIISIGFRKEELYFTLDFSERIVQGLSFSEDFIEFLMYGNSKSDNFNFSELSENLNYFHELAIGASYNVDDEMQFGLRAKLLLGGANATTRSSDINMKTSLEEWEFDSDIKMDVSIPYIDLPIDDDGFLDIDSIRTVTGDSTIEFFDIFFGLPGDLWDLLQPSELSTIGGLKNPGFAIDLGFSYTPIEKLTVSASLVDLGFIRWKNYVYNFQQEMDYTFQGLEFKLEEDYSPADELKDTLLENIKVKVTQKPYTTMLSGKVYLGVAYNLTEKVRFGGVFRTRIHNYKFYNQYTISANVQPISMFSASVSYSYYSNSYMNLGLGLSLRAGPLNVYFITDQIPSDYFWPKEFSSLNFRLGLNITWGCRAVKKAMKDRPLID